MSEGPDFPLGIPSEQPEVEETQPEPQSFEVNGQQVTLDELQSGYMRQQDYTRKTQEIAPIQSEYEQLAKYKDFIQQVETDENLKGYLNGYYEQQEQQQQQYYEQNPMVPYVGELEQRIGQMEQQQIAGVINNQLTELKATNGDKWTDEVQDSVLTTAAQLGTADIHLAYNVYKAQNLDTILAQERQSVLDELKQNKAASVEPGRAVGGGSHVEAEDITTKSYSELTRMAMQRLQGHG